MDESRVDFADDELPIDDGDLVGSDEVVADSDTTQPQQRPVSQADLDRLRSTEQKRYAQLERQYRQAEEKAAQAELRAEKNERYADLVTRWTADYIAQGHDPETARQGAMRNAKARVDQEYEQKGLKQKLDTYEARETEDQFRQSLEQLGQDVMQTLGLSEAQLKEAVAGLRPDQNGYHNEVWKRAAAHAKVLQGKSQSQRARDLRNSTPFVAGSTPVQARYQELPHNVKLGTDSGKAWLEEQKKLRRARQR